MKTPEEIAIERVTTTRPYFPRLAAASAADITIPDLWAADGSDHPDPTAKWGDILEKIDSIPNQLAPGGQSIRWPLTNAIAHFAALLTDIPKGDYETRSPRPAAPAVPIAQTASAQRIPSIAALTIPPA